MPRDSLDILRRFESVASRNSSLSDDDRRIIDQELDQMVQTIAYCTDAESADGHLQHLGTIQEILATLVFKHGAQLSSRQREIVRQFDRCDLPEVRQSAFLAIKRGEFPWKGAR